ncbi:hypothetical protein [Lysinibacillus xylanilyticus]|uniref:hypothetical protein n=1 Tax=Lysinibacillus xylanilyticus TaxID=582475 RepID=UPI003D023D8E
MILSSVAFVFLSVGWTILSVTSAILSVALIPIRRFQLSFRRVPNPIRRSNCSTHYPICVQ